MTDIDDGKPSAYDLPEASIAGALAAASPVKDKNGKPVANGLTKDDEAHWVEKTGWAPRFGTGSFPGEEDEGSMLDHQTWVEGKLEDKFFGGKFSRFTGLWIHTDRNFQTGITTLLSSFLLALLLGLSQLLAVAWRGFSS